jgi:glucosamine--fructose-6-phosphate aminotransferase (isomerizing)
MTIEVVKGRYFDDLMAQPGALAATLDELASQGRWSQVGRFLRSRSWNRIVLTGMGSSYHCLHVLNLALINAGISSMMMETSELVHYGLLSCDAQTLIVVVSQSGASAETLRLLESKGQSSVLGITNTARSPLADVADMTLLTQAGPEFSVSSKTYSTALLALQWLAALFRDEPEATTVQGLTRGAALAQLYLDDWRAHVEVLASRFQDVRHLFLIGRGRSLAAVGTGALILKESVGIHAEGMSSAAFRHGPIEMLRQGVSTIVFAGEERTRELNRRIVRELTVAGQRCDEVGSGVALVPFRLPECDPLLRPIIEILPVQMMTLALAGLGRREAGRFERASKITDTE